MEMLSAKVQGQGLKERWFARRMELNGRQWSGTLSLVFCLLCLPFRAADVCTWRWWFQIGLDRERRRQACGEVLKLQVPVGYRSFSPVIYLSIFACAHHPTPHARDSRDSPAVKPRDRCSFTKDFRSPRRTVRDMGSWGVELRVGSGTNKLFRRESEHLHGVSQPSTRSQLACLSPFILKYLPKLFTWR